ncbi:hypothetical protein NECAME_05206 [Necator americanus]|uniref:Uncharacterized protein n=1 Tax=Necator americanus TaxID=51031 RepID=W2SIY8_NECAM|nr:hypothetical protein NECAME_05206 [Necator americanus]ETN69624.1 hypothetical protein NECAME_05206 [Necator americanus]
MEETETCIENAFVASRMQYGCVSGKHQHPTHNITSSQEGWCRGHDIWGWCFHNKTDGRFDCDEEGFCAGQEQLKNKKSTGCFLRGNNTVCCCNEADGCNLGFISIAPKYAVGQEIDVGLTSVQRGCRSRKTLVHHIAKDQYTKFKNNTNWMDTERLVSLPTCADITWGAEWINGTQSMCLDFNFEVSPRRIRPEFGSPSRSAGKGHVKCNKSMNMKYDRLPKALFIEFLCMECVCVRERCDFSASFTKPGSFLEY